MYTLGIDIGSTTSKCAVLGDGRDIIATSLVVAGIGTNGPEQALKQALAGAGLAQEDIAFTVATGYGRNSWQGADKQVSELTCHALGAAQIFPDVRTIIDIGGQDAKVIALDNKGRMKEFLMNDKCAAGTGRFLDVMAAVLQLKVGELEEKAALADAPAKISSTCTVFAESEVISQLAAGVSVPNVVAGICRSVAARTAMLAKRLNIEDQVCMSGGVAQNGAVRRALAEELGHEIRFSSLCQLFGALGAAISAYRQATQ